MKFLINKQILTISEALPTEAEEILEVIKIIGGESDNLVIDKNGIPFTLEQEKAYIEKCLKSGTNKLFVGKVDKKIVCVASLGGSERERIKHNVTLGISILKEYWNLGVGTFMMDYMIAYSKISKDIRNIHLEVREDNEYAIKLYEKKGFKYVGRFTREMRIGDKFYDNLIYELIL